MIETVFGEEVIVILHMLWAYCQMHTDVMEALVEEWALKL